MDPIDSNELEQDENQCETSNVLTHYTITDEVIPIQKYSGFGNFNNSSFTSVVHGFIRKQDEGNQSCSIHSGL